MGVRSEEDACKKKSAQNVQYPDRINHQARCTRDGCTDGMAVSGRW